MGPINCAPNPYAMPIPVQTKVHSKNLQVLAVTYDMGLFSFAFDVV